MNKKRILLILVVGIFCLALGIGGCSFFWGLDKKDYERIKEEYEETQEKTQKELKELKEQKIVPKIKDGEELVVSFKDGISVSANELYTELKTQSSINTIVDMIDKRILEDKYKEQVLDAKKYAETTIEELESNYGEELEEAIQYYTGYAGVETYKNALSIQYLRELEIKEYAKKQIKEDAIKKYYEKEFFGDIKVSHILISPKITDAMASSEKESALKEAKDKADAIISLLNNTKKEEIATTFSSLAKEKSDDEGTKDKGGDLGYINSNSEMPTNFIEEVLNLEEGEYSKTPIETEYGYHIILKVKTEEKASLEKSKESIIEILAERYCEENVDVQITALEELRKEYALEWHDSILYKEYLHFIKVQKESLNQ